MKLRLSILLGVLAVFFVAGRSNAWWCRWWRGPQVIYVVPSSATYYNPSTPATKENPQQKGGAFYLTPPAQGTQKQQPAASTPMYPYPTESFEFGQPEGWWFR
jgi:hypothetical protein